MEVSDNCLKWCPRWMGNQVYKCILEWGIVWYISEREYVFYGFFLNAGRGGWRRRIEMNLNEIYWCSSIQKEQLLHGLSNLKSRTVLRKYINFLSLCLSLIQCDAFCSGKWFFFEFYEFSVTCIEFHLSREFSLEREQYFYQLWERKFRERGLIIMNKHMRVSLKP